MKIIRKTKFHPSVEFLYHAKNDTDDDMTIELCNSYLITGKFAAISTLEFMNTGEAESRITYFPNYQDPTFIDDNTFDPDYTPPEINFRLKSKGPMNECPRDVYDKMFEPIIIPPHTGSISLEITPGDNVAIYAGTIESYAIIDDDGNEIPLESILPSKNRQQ